MGIISKTMMETLRPIAEAIDTALELPQEERKAFLIRTPNARSMKSNLVMYKSMLRRDWNGRFWMVKSEEGLWINFSPSRVLAYSIAKETADIERPKFQIEYRDPSEPNPRVIVDTGKYGSAGAAVRREMNDQEIMLFLMEENPVNTTYAFLCLDQQTQKYIFDPKNEEEPALIRFLQRRGYKWEYYPSANPTLRIYVEGVLGTPGSSL
jgi:hypothetical protein